MLNALEAMRPSLASFEVMVVDIDSDPELIRNYDQLVPVLKAKEVELSRYKLDEQTVRVFFALRP